MWRALRRFYKIFEDFQRESKKYVCCPKAISYNGFGSQGFMWEGTYFYRNLFDVIAMFFNLSGEWFF